MAITKYKVIQKNLEAVINYAKNGDKTEKGEKEDFLIKKRFKDNKEKAEKEIDQNMNKKILRDR